MKGISKRIFIILFLYIYLLNCISCNHRQQDFLRQKLLESQSGEVTSIPLRLHELKESFSLTKEQELELQTHSKHQFKQQIAFELKIDSPDEYVAYLSVWSNHNVASLYKFSNYQGFHYLQVNYKQNQSADILLVKLPSQYSIINEGEKKDDDLSDNYEKAYDLSIKFLQEKTKYCPFNCHNHGICHSEGKCSCISSYSSDYHCLYEISKQTIEIGQKANFTQNNESLLEDTAQIMVEQPNIKNDFYQYGMIQVANMQEFKKQYLQRYAFYSKVQGILVSFSYEKSDTTEDLGDLSIFNKNNYFSSLATHKENESYLSTHALTIFDLQEQNYFLNSSVFVFFQYSSQVRNLQIEITVIEDDISQYTILIQFLIVFVSLVLLFIYLVSTLQELQQYQEDRIKQSKKEEIENILQRYAKTQSYDKFQLEKQKNSSYNECFICLQTYSESEELCQIECGHLFHKLCLKEWMNKKLICPIDRIDIIQKNSNLNETSYINNQ